MLPDDPWDQCFVTVKKGDVYLYPDLGFWTYLIANGDHTKIF